MSKTKYAAPPPNPENQEFWDAAAQGRYLVKHCAACGASHYYPRALCPFCFSDRTEWKPASGKATIYSFSVMRRVDEPYAVAYVTLEEGPTLMTNIVDCDLDKLRIDQSVRVVFKPTEGGPPLPMFTPA